ncbi:hypothetical protein AbHV_ORF13 [Abalone herpesvirus Victoria/AUS/2009]|uniref:Uncharacterized protein n=1 Tax=Abalone herpesvirus (isolate Abalone/Australia/Victoria/2009) TaxID=1241371 RepID=K4JYE5_ABHV|nr:hypothetical protein AbHV_ORF13 [Abalone herpesvirus Victoria/AUS/2009]AFU90023.1 hypothetical protein AbHV_ORF13 [Abalone herpesvirus Victoria/AUS/2009]UCX57002.1 ORF12 [Haliotid herpesvirus 1]
MAFNRMMNRTQTKQEVMRDMERRNKAVKTYGPYTHDSQIERTTSDTNYAWGGGKKPKVQFLTSQIVSTGTKSLTVKDFKVTAPEFDMDSAPMWTWVKELISGTVKQLIGKSLISSNLFFGMNMAAKPGDPNSYIYKMITSRADGSLDGYFANDWYQVTPIVDQVISEFKRQHKNSGVKGERSVAFYVEVDIAYFQNGVTTLPFELDRERVIAQGVRAMREDNN